jgi:hypothetical protein
MAGASEEELGLMKNVDRAAHRESAQQQTK